MILVVSQPWSNAMPNTYITVSNFTPEGEKRFDAFLAQNAPFEELPATLTRRMECLFALEEALNAGKLPVWKPAGKPTFDPGVDGVLVSAHTLPEDFIEAPEEE
jgi:hypothetical protein